MNKQTRKKKSLKKGSADRKVTSGRPRESQSSVNEQTAQLLPDMVDQVSLFRRQPMAQRQAIMQRISRTQGNRRTSRLIERLQRHPDHDEPIMRAVLPPEATQMGTVNAGAAPLALMDNTGAGATSQGDLAAGDNVRILGRRATQARVHVETGAHRGKIGWVPQTSITVSTAPTSQRTPGAGPENAYSLLQTALAASPPDRGTILDMIEFRLTPAQQLRFSRTGNPEFAQFRGLGVITANDVMHVLGVLGVSLQRKLNDYFAKRGRTARELRLAFATAEDHERLQVARDDALVGRLRRVLGGVHPEIVFGPVLAQLYPDDGSLTTLRTTNPELARWLGRHTSRRADIGELAEGRAEGLQNALTTVNTDGASRARPTVMSAVNAAPRGMSLPDAERTALDQIEERAYPESAYTNRDLGIMFLTRWARPFRRARSVPKTFLHRLYQALKRLPLEHVLLNNVLTYFAENRDPAAAGSFMDFLSSSQFGQLLSDRPTPETVHAAGAQRGRTIGVVEPTIDLIRPGTQVTVTESDGSTTTTRVRSVNVRRRRLTLSRSVNVAGGANIVPQGASQFRESEAVRITSPAIFYANNAGQPNLSSQLGTLAVGNLFSQMGERTVGGTRYLGGAIHAGPLRGQVGWIEASKVTSLGGETMGQAMFEWTARHEMGHALDLQINGFSRFSRSSTARWRKYTGVNDWLADLINTASVANPDTVQTFNGVNMTFRRAARTYSSAVQSQTTGNAAAQQAQQWLQGWQASPGGNANVYNVVTQFNADPNYFNRNNLGLPALGGRIFAAHYSEWFSASAAARQESLSVGVPPYAYTCTYEFFADHYAAYTLPGTPPAQYARAVPGWAQNFFDRMVGEAGAGPREGMQRRRMGRP